MQRDRLPIDDVLDEICAKLRATPRLVLRAPTGAGKTTRVAPALLDEGLAGTGRAILLEPRRLAARAAAARMARERATPLGAEVGYQVRFERCAGPSTRLLVVTEGVFLRMLQADPFLEGIGAVLFDEFHERNLQSDLALAMVASTQREMRTDLRMVVMSATLDPAPIASYLEPCETVVSAGREHPVAIRHHPLPPRTPPARAARMGVQAALEGGGGDLLVFLPGRGEIRAARAELEALARRRALDLLELYGDLPLEKQDAILQPSPRRKLILATNVAETSITIPGVRAVVDLGLVKRLRFDPAVGLDRLQLERVSRASADQRAGRAGRTAPGTCLRLWSELEQRSLPAQEEAEIRRIDIAGAILQLLHWGEPDPRRFAWLEAPREEALAAALELLARLGALDGRALTPSGHAMAELPVHPRIARLLLEGARRGVGARVALVAACLAERDPFPRPDPRTKTPSHTSDSDCLERARALERFERSGDTHSVFGELQRGAARTVLRARDQLVRLLGEGAAPTNPPAHADAEVLQSLLAAFPDRVARRRERGSPRAVLVGGKGVRQSASSTVLDSELLLCVELQAGRAEALVRQASAIERAWLDPNLITVRQELLFDEETERVVAREGTRYMDLVLDQKNVPGTDASSIARCLEEAARRSPQRALDLADPALQTLRARTAFLREHMPELDLPDLGDAVIDDLLPHLCQGRRSFAELRRAPLLEHLRARLAPHHLRALAQHAPERLEVPGGSRITLRYEPGRPPVLAARIQEIFGWKETPRLAAGRVKVLLHLLAPNMRPQQITDDLPSFWRNGYPEVRKELRRRYPKHAWPEDPLSGARGAG